MAQEVVPHNVKFPGQEDRGCGTVTVTMSHWVRDTWSEALTDVTMFVGPNHSRSSCASLEYGIKI